MNTTARKVRVTVALPQFEADYIRKEAKRIGWSISALAGEYILDGMYKRPNADTLAAIEEARQGKYAGVVDTSSFEAFMKSFDE